MPAQGGHDRNKMIPTFIISLSEETARREAIAAHLKDRGFNFEFFDAVDGRQMNVLNHPDYNAPRRRAAHGRDLKPGELGCFLSHRNFYRFMVKNDIDYALLLEDDARLHESTKATLEALIDKDIAFDIIRLLGSPKVAKGKHRKITPLYKDFHLVRLRTAPGGAHATLISRQGAEKLVRATEKFAFPIDTVLGRGWETGITAFSIQPGLAVQDLSFDSAIGEERHDKSVTPKGLKFKCTRLAFKISEALGKAWVYWSTRASDLAISKKFS
ncbi:MAG: glycosyltransferase family 25 protein [Rhodospirillales bacterium]|nr:MAG: glycosyltransferase family 25 protein [Rhodospirillales bacterium]